MESGVGEPGLAQYVVKNNTHITNAEGVVVVQGTTHMYPRYICVYIHVPHIMYPIQKCTLNYFARSKYMKSRDNRRDRIVVNCRKWKRIAFFSSCSLYPESCRCLHSLWMDLIQSYSSSEDDENVRDPDDGHNGDVVDPPENVRDPDDVDQGLPAPPEPAEEEVEVGVGGTELETFFSSHPLLSSIDLHRDKRWLKKDYGEMIVDAADKEDFVYLVTKNEIRQKHRRNRFSDEVRLTESGR
jgi:hypothetical protein